MGKMSRDKGKIGEREVAALLKAHGFEARRGQQFHGGGNSPDVVHDIPLTHIEVKRTESLSLYAAMAQAEEDSRGSGNKPVVFHRRNGKPWLVIMYADDYLSLENEALLSSRELSDRGEQDAD